MTIIIHARGELYFQRIQRVFVSRCAWWDLSRAEIPINIPGLFFWSLHERPRAKRASATDFRDDTLNGKAERWHPNSELRWRSLEAVLSALTVNDRPFKSFVSRFIAPCFWFYVMRFSFEDVAAISYALAFLRFSPFPPFLFSSFSPSMVTHLFNEIDSNGWNGKFHVEHPR